MKGTLGQMQAQIHACARKNRATRRMDISASHTCYCKGPLVGRKRPVTIKNGRPSGTTVSMRLDGYSPPLEQPFRDVTMVFVALTPLP
jgi:hypothetical protein